MIELEEIIEIIKLNLENKFDDWYQTYLVLPNIYKKYLILYALGNNNVLLFKKIKSFLVEKNIEEKVMKYSEILELISDYIGVSDIEKDKFGEVFTPSSLIEDMLDTLPQEVWSNPDLKWLDPANGIGNFPAIVIKRLMGGLKDFQSDPELRYKHILENMIYVCDIQSKNMFIYLLLFNPDNKYKMNFYKSSFLKDDFEDKMLEWGVDNFDIIIGNPPYNKEHSDKSSGHSLWDNFVRHSLKCLRVNGYLLFVHPPLWRKPISENGKSNDLWKLITSDRQLVYLNIESREVGKKVFDASTRYDYYLIENANKYKNTIIIDEKNNKIELDLEKWDFLPNYNFGMIEKLLGVGEILFERSAYGSDKKWVSKEENEIFKFKLIHTTPKNGVRYLYSSINNKGLFGIPKVIFGDGGTINDVVIDFEGNYGMSEHSMGIPIESLEQGIKLKDYLLSSEFKNILSACSWSNYQIDWRLFKYLDLKKFVDNK